MTMNEVCGDNRFEVIARAKEHIIKSTNIEVSKDEMKCLDNFLFRCWQMGWLKQYESASEIPNKCEKTQMVDKSTFSKEQYRADLQCAFDCGKASVECEDCLKRYNIKTESETIDYRRAFKIACELLNGDILYGVDSDAIFEIIMERVGFVCNESYEEYILNHLQELDHGQYAEREET